MTKYYPAAVLLFLSFVVYTSAADWHQWRFDAQRCGASAENGPAQGNLLWTADLGQPNPAYDHQFRMCADAAYAPVAAEGLLFVPSNTADHVAAFDLKTGRRRWRFFAEGPVRFAPAYDEGSLYFGADDGRLYCVNASTGELRWKHRAVPDRLPDARMLINGRMCSRWPLRGAPVIADGTVHAGAGIWPEEGVYVSAFNAATGELRWQSDTLSFVENGMSDHGKAYDLSLPPHGYLAVIDGKLAVPSGRTLAAWFDLETGAMEPYTCYYTKTNPPRGMWNIFGRKHYAVQGGNWFATQPGTLPVPDTLKGAVNPLYWSKQPPENELLVIKNRPFLRTDTYNVHGENFYTEPILTDDAIYQSQFDDEEKYIIPRGHTRVKRQVYDKIVARDLTSPRWTTVKQRHFAQGKQVVEATRLEFPILWEMKSPLKVLAKAGRFLYAGGENTIAAIRIPPPAPGPLSPGKRLSAVIRSARLLRTAS